MYKIVVIKKAGITMKIPEDFGDYFRRLRRSRGYRSQKELAEKTGFSQASISRIENGEQIPTVESLKIYAEIFQVPLSELLKKANIKEVILEHQNGDTTVKYQKEKNEKRLLSLENPNILHEFNLLIDGKKLSKSEYIAMISFVRSLRNF